MKKVVLKEWVEIIVVIITAIFSIIGIGATEAGNTILVVISMIINLINCYIICKYGRDRIYF